MTFNQAKGALKGGSYLLVTYGGVNRATQFILMPDGIRISDQTARNLLDQPNCIQPNGDAFWPELSQTWSST